jgi:hydrogenase maturation protein HypF
VYRCAQRFQLGGFVANGPEGVLIEAEGEDLNAFVAALREELPPLARIDSLLQVPLVSIGEPGFRIAATRSGAAAGAAIPADTAICDSCLQELFDPENRRYLHPFIACCDCGPRYTMSRALPYDRDTTSMADFKLCPACELEYTDPASRRFHAEPVACHNCGPRLSLPVGDLCSALDAGEIVAIKGIGGYHLACDARDPDAVARLRRRKNRDGKPFAVMVLNAASAARWVQLGEQGSRLLQSRERPVVILPAHGDAGGLGSAVSRGLATLGLMLPYSGFHYLLFHQLLGRPPGYEWLQQPNDLALVMTSANLSGDPLIIDSAEAEQRLAAIAERILHHDREIAARADDSVVRLGGDQPMLVRRARGYAPQAIPLAKAGPSVLAVGAHLKSSIAMTRGDQAYLSAHVGDLSTPAAVAFHARTVDALLAMLQTQPLRLACDLNPDYASSRLAQQLSEQWQLPLVRVQHHHAHGAAVLAEHRFEGDALALVLDGHGQGYNGESWGGELLRLQGAAFERLGHFAALSLPGGDWAAREPWRIAAGVLHHMGRGDEIAGRFGDQALAPAMARLLAAGDVATTTSAGRLFDAAAALLGICQRASYEGEPPMLLEGLVRQPRPLPAAYSINRGVLDFSGLLAALADCESAALGAEYLHGTLLQALQEWVLDAARRTGIETVALAGGCFLNAHLANALPRRLEQQGLRVLTARCLPPNDGAICLGQAWVAQRSTLNR